MPIENEDQVDFNGNEMIDVRLQQLGADPSTAKEGQIWWRNDLNFARANDGARNRSLCWQDPEFIDFIPLDVVPAWKEGRVFYDNASHTLTVYDNVTSTALNVGTETRIRVRNKTGSTITNGTFVYVSGVTGQIPEISKAIATAQKARQVIGCMTHDILHNGFGWVTVIGSCSDINTTGFPEGSIIYLSGTVAGAWSLTPYAGNEIVLGCILYEHGVNGKLFCRPSDGNDYLQIATANKLKLFRGFVDTNRGITYDHINRTWTLTGTGTTEISWDGVISTISLPWTSPAHAATTNVIHYLYSSDGVNYVTSTTPWDYSYIQVANAYYDANSLYRFGMKETHGATQDPEDHRQNHQARGTYRVSGGTLTAGSYQKEPASPANADNRPLFDSTTISDEDKQTTNAASLAESYTRFFADSSGAVSWFLADSNMVAIGSTYPLWDNAGSPTELANNRFMWIYRIEMPVTDDAQSQQFRTFLVPGSEFFMSKAGALTGAIKYRIGNLSTISAEFVCVRRILIGTSAAYSTTGKFRIVEDELVEGSRASSVIASVGGITGTITAGFIPVAAGPSSLIDSTISYDGTTVDINASLEAKLSNSGSRRLSVSSSDVQIRPLNTVRATFDDTKATFASPIGATSISGGANKTSVASGSTNNEINSFAEFQEFRFSANVTYSVKSLKTPLFDGAMITASFTAATARTASAILEFVFGGTPSTGYSKLLWGKDFSSAGSWTITGADTYPRSATFRYSLADDAWILISVGGA